MNLLIWWWEANEVCLSQETWGFHWGQVLREKSVEERLYVCKEGKWFTIITMKSWIRKPTVVALQSSLNLVFVPHPWDSSIQSRFTKRKKRSLSMYLPLLVLFLARRLWKLLWFWRTYQFSCSWSHGDVFSVIQQVLSRGLSLMSISQGRQSLQCQASNFSVVNSQFSWNFLGCKERHGKRESKTKIN